MPILALLPFLCISKKTLIEFFTTFPQHKNDNIANIVLAMPFKINKTIKSATLKVIPFTLTNIFRYQ